MELKPYLESLPRGGAKDLADRLGISQSFLSQMASGKAPISPERAVLIETETEGYVTRQDIYPGRWQLIWPELQETSPDQKKAA